MGAEGSKKVVREQKEYFTPEERQSVLAVAQKLASSSSGNISLSTLEVRKNLALLQKHWRSFRYLMLKLLICSYWLELLVALITGLLQKHIAKYYNPEIAARFVKVLIRGKTPTPTFLTCPMLVDSLGPLTKGTLEQHLYLTVTLAGGDQAGVDSDSIVKVICTSLLCMHCICTPKCSWD